MRPSPSAASRRRASSRAPRRQRARRRRHGRRASSRPGPVNPARKSGAASRFSAARRLLSAARPWRPRPQCRSLRPEAQRRSSWGASITPPMKTLLAVLALTAALAASAFAQDTPRSGGELIFVVAAEPPSFAANHQDTFASLHPRAPQYHTLLRAETSDPTGT